MTGQEPESLAVAYERELERNRKLLTEYQALPAASGWFGVAMLQHLIAQAEAASTKGDVVAMLGLYEELKETQ